METAMIISSCDEFPPSDQRDQLPMSRRAATSSTTASILDDGPNRFAFVHQIEAFVDPIERKHVRDQIVDVDLLLHVPIDDLRHIGAAARAAECGAFPHSAGDELERARAYFLS